MADVEISYKGNKIAELSESGTKILKTSGKYCEGDITVDYTKTGNGLILEFDEYISTASSSDAIALAKESAKCWEEPPYLNTVYAKDFGTAFKANKRVKKMRLNISSATSLYNTFNQCTALEHLTLIGQPSTLGDIRLAFGSCNSLITIDGDAFDFSHLNPSYSDNQYLFQSCSALEDVRFVANSIPNTISFEWSPNLTKTSVISVLNGLMDLSDKTSKTVTFSSALNYDDTDPDVMSAITTAVSKNWVVKFGSRIPTGV